MKELAKWENAKEVALTMSQVALVVTFILFILEINGLIKQLRSGVLFQLDTTLKEVNHLLPPVTKVVEDVDKLLPEVTTLVHSVNELMPDIKVIVKNIRRDVEIASRLADDADMMIDEANELWDYLT